MWRMSCFPLFESFFHSRMPTLTGYGPRKDSRRHRNTPLIDRDEEKYEIWETKFLGRLGSLSLKDAIFGVNLTEDDERNKEAYAELVQFPDDKGLSLILREAADNERKSLNILRGHYAGKRKPGVISLYTQLTSFKNGTNENVTDYVIRTETILTATRNAGQTVDDALITTMILKGLPRHLNPFSIYVSCPVKNVNKPDHSKPRKNATSGYDRK